MPAISVSVKTKTLYDLEIAVQRTGLNKSKITEDALTRYLAEILEDDDEDMACAAVEALGKLNDPRAVPALISTLQREAWTLKFHAIRILGEMHVNRAFIDLLRLLDEDTLDLKNHIIKALSQIPHVRCFEELKKRFETEKDPDTRLAYIEAL